MTDSPSPFNPCDQSEEIINGPNEVNLNGKNVKEILSHEIDPTVGKRQKHENFDSAIETRIVYSAQVFD